MRRRIGIMLPAHADHAVPFAGLLRRGLSRGDMACAQRWTAVARAPSGESRDQGAPRSLPAKPGALAPRNLQDWMAMDANPCAGRRTVAASPSLATHSLATHSLATHSLAARSLGRAWAGPSCASEQKSTTRGRRAPAGGGPQLAQRQRSRSLTQL